MARVIRSFRAANIIAGFEEMPGGGARFDLDAPRNLPAKYPHLYLDRVHFHVDFGVYALALLSLDIPITHPAVPGVAGTQLSPPNTTGTAANVAVLKVGQALPEDHLLATHNLGYVPPFRVIYGGKMIAHGTPIQVDDPNRVRFVCAYATTTEIRLKGTGISTASALSSAVRSYGVMVFERPVANPGLPLFSKRPEGVQLGRGKLASWKPTLRLTGDGTTPYGFATAPTVDYKNGGMRFFAGNATPVDIGGYNGTFVSPPIINVGV